MMHEMRSLNGGVSHSSARDMRGELGVGARSELTTTTNRKKPSSTGPTGILPASFCKGGTRLARQLDR